MKQENTGKFTLYLQFPKPKKIGLGVLAIERSGEANFFSENPQSLLCSLTRVKLDCAGKDGIMLSGFELSGTEKSGTPKFRFQEWWLVYSNNSYP